MPAALSSAPRQHERADDVAATAARARRRRLQLAQSSGPAPKISVEGPTQRRRHGVEVAAARDASAAAPAPVVSRFELRRPALRVELESELSAPCPQRPRGVLATTRLWRSASSRTLAFTARWKLNSKRRAVNELRAQAAEQRNLFAGGRSLLRLGFFLPADFASSSPRVVGGEFIRNGSWGTPSSGGRNVISPPSSRNTGSVSAVRCSGSPAVAEMAAANPAWSPSSSRAGRADDPRGGPQRADAVCGFGQRLRPRSSLRVFDAGDRARSSGFGSSASFCESIPEPGAGAFGLAGRRPSPRLRGEPRPAFRRGDHRAPGSTPDLAADPVTPAVSESFGGRFGRPRRGPQRFAAGAEVQEVERRRELSGRRAAGPDRFEGLRPSLRG